MQTRVLLQDVRESQIATIYLSKKINDNFSTLLHPWKSRFWHKPAFIRIKRKVNTSTFLWISNAYIYYLVSNSKPTRRTLIRLTWNMSKGTTHSHQSYNSQCTLHILQILHFCMNQQRVWNPFVCSDMV